MYDQIKQFLIDTGAGKELFLRLEKAGQCRDRDMRCAKLLDVVDDTLRKHLLEIELGQTQGVHILPSRLALYDGAMSWIVTQTPNTQWVYRMGQMENTLYELFDIMQDQGVKFTKMPLWAQRRQK